MPNTAKNPAAEKIMILFAAPSLNMIASSCIGLMLGALCPLRLGSRKSETHEQEAQSHQPGGDFRARWLLPKQ